MRCGGTSKPNATSPHYQTPEAHGSAIDAVLLTLGMEPGAPAPTEDSIVALDEFSERIPCRHVEFLDFEVTGSALRRDVVEEARELGGAGDHRPMP